MGNVFTVLPSLMSSMFEPAPPPPPFHSREETKQVAYVIKLSIFLQVWRVLFLGAW